jgi:hypothetical protein
VGAISYERGNPVQSEEGTATIEDATKYKSGQDLGRDQSVDVDATLVQIIEIVIITSFWY